MKKGQKSAPEKGMTYDEARAFASGLGSNCLDRDDGSLSYFILLLRWLAYEADDTTRENLYIQTEEEFAAYFEGVDEAIQAQMRRTLEALRRRKGSAEG